MYESGYTLYNIIDDSVYWLELITRMKPSYAYLTLVGDLIYLIPWTLVNLMTVC